MNGQRIKLARKKAGLSLRGLADKMGGLVSAQAIGKYERGEMSPGSDAMRAMSKALGVSIYYLSAPEEVVLGAMEFRRKLSATAKDRARVETEVIEWVERYLQIEEILGLESISWKSPKGIAHAIDSEDEAEKTAGDLRSSWKLGIDPIPNMTELLEERGIKVLLAELPDKVSGITCLVTFRGRAQETPVIVVNQGHSIERRRFTMAHELGHRLVRGKNMAVVERFCDRFAGAFLLNREHLLREIGERRSAFGVREIMELKRIYRVSAAAFLIRLEQIGVLDRYAKEYAFRTFANGWRSTEPEPLEPPNSKERQEAPKRFERLVYRAVAEDMVSLSKAVELLRVPLATVEKGLRGPAAKHADRR